MSSVSSDEVTRFADMLAAMGAEPRLRVIRLLLEAHPTGMIAGDLSSALSIAPGTLSHHLERLKREGIVNVRRDGTFLWYTASTGAIEDLMKFLFAECCTRSQAIEPERLTFITR